MPTTRTFEKPTVVDVSGTLYHLLLPFRETMATSHAAWFGPVVHDLGLLATVLGRYDEAEAHFARAVEIQDRIQARGSVFHTRMEWAGMLLRRHRPGDTSRARALLDQARVGTQELRVSAVEARIDELEHQIHE